MLQFVTHRENGDEMWLALLRLPSVILPQMFSQLFSRSTSDQFSMVYLFTKEVRPFFARIGGKNDSFG